MTSLNQLIFISVFALCVFGQISLLSLDYVNVAVGGCVANATQSTISQTLSELYGQCVGDPEVGLLMSVLVGSNPGLLSYCLFDDEAHCYQLTSSAHLEWTLDTFNEVDFYEWLDFRLPYLSGCDIEKVVSGDPLCSGCSNQGSFSTAQSGWHPQSGSGNYSLVLQGSCSGSCASINTCCKIQEKRLAAWVRLADRGPVVKAMSLRDNPVPVMKLDQFRTTSSATTVLGSLTIRSNGFTISQNPDFELEGSVFTSVPSQSSTDLFFKNGQLIAEGNFDYDYPTGCQTPGWYRTSMEWRTDVGALMAVTPASGCQCDKSQCTSPPTVQDCLMDSSEIFRGLTNNKQMISSTQVKETNSLMGAVVTLWVPPKTYVLTRIPGSAYGLDCQATVRNGIATIICIGGSGSGSLRATLEGCGDSQDFMLALMNGEVEGSLGFSDCCELSLSFNGQPVDLEVISCLNDEIRNRTNADRTGQGGDAGDDEGDNDGIRVGTLPIGSFLGILGSALCCPCAICLAPCLLLLGVLALICAVAGISPIAVVLLIIWLIVVIVVMTIVVRLGIYLVRKAKEANLNNYDHEF